MIRSVDLNVRVTEADKQRLRALAKINRITLSAYLRDLINEGLERRFGCLLEPIAQRGRPRRIP